MFVHYDKRDTSDLTRFHGYIQDYQSLVWASKKVIIDVFLYLFGFLEIRTLTVLGEFPTVETELFR